MWSADTLADHVRRPTNDFGKTASMWEYLRRRGRENQLGWAIAAAALRSRRSCATHLRSRASQNRLEVLTVRPCTGRVSPSRREVIQRRAGCGSLNYPHSCPRPSSRPSRYIYAKNHKEKHSPPRVRG